jgi:hypothetical protein
MFSQSKRAPERHLLFPLVGGTHSETLPQIKPYLWTKICWLLELTQWHVYFLSLTLTTPLSCGPEARQFERIVPEKSSDSKTSSFSMDVGIICVADKSVKTIPYDKT